MLLFITYNSFSDLTNGKTIQDLLYHVSLHSTLSLVHDDTELQTKKLKTIRNVTNPVCTGRTEPQPDLFKL